MIREKHCLITSKARIQYNILSKEMKTDFSCYSCNLYDTKIKAYNGKARWIIFKLRDDNND